MSHQSGPVFGVALAATLVGGGFEELSDATRSTGEVKGSWDLRGKQAFDEFQEQLALALRHVRIEIAAREISVVVSPFLQMG